MTETVQTLPSLPSATQRSTNFCMYYIEDGEAGRNASQALKSCCSPNSVHSESQNSQWCEIPDRFFQDLPESGHDVEASRWLQGNFTLCQTKQSSTIGAHYCTLPRYNTELGAAASIQGQYQLGFVCLAIWLLWLRLN